MARADPDASRAAPRRIRRQPAGASGLAGAPVPVRAVPKSTPGGLAFTSQRKFAPLDPSARCRSPAGPQPQALKDLSALIVRSLGAPQFYQASVDKALLQPLMQAAGVRVPEFRLVRTPEQAETAARELGPRVVVKPSDGTGGRHVIDCATPDAAAAAFRLLLDQAGRNPAPGAAPSVLIQRRIDGLMVPRSSVAYEGRELAGFALERLQHCAASRSRRSISRRIFADDDAVSAGILARRGESRAAPLSERYSMGRSGALP